MDNDGRFANRDSFKTVENVVSKKFKKHYFGIGKIIKVDSLEELEKFKNGYTIIYIDDITKSNKLLNNIKELKYKFVIEKDENFQYIYIIKGSKNYGYDVTDLNYLQNNIKNLFKVIAKSNNSSQTQFEIKNIYKGK